MADGRGDLEDRVTFLRELVATAIEEEAAAVADIATAFAIICIQHYSEDVSTVVVTVFT